MDNVKRVQGQLAFVLHRRAYRETSALIDLFTQDYGLMRVVAKGVRQTKSRLNSALQPFTPLLVSWVGRGELMTLAEAEMDASVISLQGHCLFAGFYLNELLSALLEPWDPHPKLYQYYHHTLFALQTTPLDETVLRGFELDLLAELGYALFPSQAAVRDKLFQPDLNYLFLAEQGFVRDEQQRFGSPPPNQFDGQTLLLIAARDWQAESTRLAAKRLMRLAFHPLLGGKVLHSRQLFVLPEVEVQHA